MPSMKVALVTGASSGIGAALVDRLTRHGYQVVAADIDPLGPDAVKVDVSDLDSCHRMVEEVMRRHGRLDLVALNAGINSRQRGLEPLSLNAYRDHLAVNLDGVVFGIDAARKGLSNPGAIVVTASLAALAPELSNPLYTAAKSAVLGYVRAMSPLLADEGVTINAVCPAFVDTPMLEDRRERLIDSGIPLITPEEVASVLHKAAENGQTGQAWAMVAGSEPFVYEFSGVG